MVSITVTVPPPMYIPLHPARKGRKVLTFGQFRVQGSFFRRGRRKKVTGRFKKQALAVPAMMSIPSIPTMPPPMLITYCLMR